MQTSRHFIQGHATLKVQSDVFKVTVKVQKVQSDVFKDTRR